jgi:transcriptional regulator GlxA family with amidase domain
MKSIFEMALSAPHDGGEDVDGLLESLASTLTHEYLLQARMASTDGTVHPEPLAKALACVERRFAEPWTVASLAREVHVSPNHLIRLFRTHMGETPAARLWSARVRHGVELLRDTGLGVKEIAHRCGFKTPFHFSRRVAKLHGAPPRELRRNAWSGGS